MNVDVRLFASLRQGRFQQATMDLREGETLGELLERLQIRPHEVGISMVNGRHASLERTLAEGDSVALFPPIAGG